MSLNKVLTFCTIFLLAGCLAGQASKITKPKVTYAGPVVVEKAKPVSDYLNPTASVADAKNNKAYIALAGSLQIAVIDLATEKVLIKYNLPGEPTGMALSDDGEWLAVTTGRTDGKVVILDTADGKVLQRFQAGFSPRNPVFLHNASQLAICNRFSNSVGFYNVADGSKIKDVPVKRDPYAAIPSPGGKVLYVANFLPAMRADDSEVASLVEIIDLNSFENIKSIQLPNGTTAVRDLALSPDGRYLFATHLIGHHQVPTNQLERGWMNTNAMSIIDVTKRELKETVLLDDTTLGAANPWGVAASADGKTLVVAHAGTHEISCIPMKPLLEIIERGQVDEIDPNQPAETKSDYDYNPNALANDLRAMMKAGRYRIQTPGDGPQNVTIAGTKVLVNEYFSGKLAVFDLAEESHKWTPPREVSLGDQPEMDEVRYGEMRFSDARLCFQGWQSCLSCHPDVRSDALNWDLLNDGVGNPKQSKSMLLSHHTPPVMARGVRAKAEVAVRAGIRYIQFAAVVESDAKAIDAYLKQLQPTPSPRLVNGKLSELAMRGKTVFDKTGCSTCHNGTYYTDMQSYEIPYAKGLDKGATFDTPTLMETWRTAPYLYDGRAATMDKALRIHFGADLSDDEMEALVEYVLSL